MLVKCKKEFLLQDEVLFEVEKEYILEVNSAGLISFRYIFQTYGMSVLELKEYFTLVLF